MTTLSFQSQVVAGHVGNTAARAAFAALGRGLWEIPTVLFSNHPAGRTFAGEVVDPDLMRRLVRGLLDNGLMAGVDTIVSGYMRTPDQVAVVGEAVDRARSAKPSLRFICDPVLGDRPSGLYVPEDVAAAVRDDLIPRATVAIPNHFELDFLTGRQAEDDAAVWRAARDLQAMGPEVVIVTSVATHDSPADSLRVFLLDRSDGWIIETPRVRSPAHGAGDLLAALFVARAAAGIPAVESLSLAVSGVYGVVQATGQRLDLALPESRGELVAPSTVFTAEAKPLPS